MLPKTYLKNGQILRIPLGNLVRIHVNNGNGDVLTLVSNHSASWTADVTRTDASNMLDLKNLDKMWLGKVKKCEFFKFQEVCH